MTDSSSNDDLPIGTLQEWKAWKKPLPLLDLRSLEDPPIPGAVHIPLAQVRQRSYELPPRQDSFAVVVPEGDEALQVIREFSCVETQATTQRNDGEPKTMDRALGDCADPEECRNWETIINATTNTNENNFTPLPRLWKPDSMVQQVLLPFLKERLQEKPNTPNKLQEIWDLGARADEMFVFWRKN